MARQATEVSPIILFSARGKINEIKLTKKNRENCQRDIEEEGEEEEEE